MPRRICCFVGRGRDPGSEDNGSSFVLDDFFLVSFVSRCTAFSALRVLSAFPREAHVNGDGTGDGAAAASFAASEASPAAAATVPALGGKNLDFLPLSCFALANDTLSTAAPLPNFLPAKAPFFPGIGLASMAPSPLAFSACFDLAAASFLPADFPVETTFSGCCVGKSVLPDFPLSLAARRGSFGRLLPAAEAAGIGCNDDAAFAADVTTPALASAAFAPFSLPSIFSACRRRGSTRPSVCLDDDSRAPSDDIDDRSCFGRGDFKDRDSFSLRGSFWGGGEDLRDADGTSDPVSAFCPGRGFESEPLFAWWCCGNLDGTSLTDEDAPGEPSFFSSPPRPRR
mmetsp:Transcript_27929/g.82091  ORF Transcript_27929/g.82091 Transcript_27929/m.82091 type:complete len:342 (-) Transcript_27929:512-1537(-)